MCIWHQTQQLVAGLPIARTRSAHLCSSPMTRWVAAAQAAARIWPVAFCQHRLRLANKAPATLKTMTRPHKSGS